MRRLALSGFVCLLVSSLAFAQQRSKVELVPSETLFTILTAMNTCGYNDGLSASPSVRTEVRSQVKRAIDDSPTAAAATREMCTFYRDHRSGEANSELSQYVSLALNLGPAPDLKLKVKEADLPPDTSYVLGFVPLVAKFYTAVDLHKIWTQAQPKYDALIEGVHEPLANMILTTDVYLKNPITGYLGREFVVYMEPMADSGQVNARNYGSDYFLVTSPNNGKIPMDQVRHTYLHFLLDPLALKRPAAMKRLEPILKDIQSAPLDNSYKNDPALMVTESLIRAIEARLIPGGKAAEPRRDKEVADDMSDGFVLTRYFYDALVKFEPEPTGLKDAFPDWLYYMDVSKLHKVARETQFASKARGEVVRAPSAEKKPVSPLELAQQKLSEGDLAGAEKIARDVAGSNGADAPQAYFILGQTATLNRDKESAINNFNQALQTAKDPKLIAWAHIYLGRIYDVDQERDMAVKHYQAALRAGDDTPQTKAAAERGLQSPYQRRGSSDQEKQ